MMVSSKRALVLGGAVAVLVAAVMMARGNDPADSAAAPARRGASQPGAAATANVPVADVRLELLQQHRPDLEETERNLFRFQPRAAPAAPVETRPTITAPKPSVPTVAVPSGPPAPPPIPLRFIGLVDAPTQAGRVAIFSDGRNNVFYGKDGDIIEGRYKVLKVSQDAAELSYVDGRGRQTIRLTGQ
jgi:hypothetical protein